MTAPSSSKHTIRVLVALADRALANTIDLTLRHGSYVRRTAGSVKDAEAALAEWKPHLLVLDIDLEAGAGIQLIDVARAGGPIGVIALTRRSDLRGKLDAFERGADDYIGIPFVPDDLVARARAVLRRTHGTEGQLVPSLRIGDLEIDVLNRKVLAGDHELHLTSLEQALLYLLAANAGSVLTREQILDAAVGHRLRDREQRRRPARAGAPREAAGRLAQAAVHRDRRGKRLSIRSCGRGSGRARALADRRGTSRRRGSTPRPS